MARFACSRFHRILPETAKIRSSAARQQPPLALVTLQKGAYLLGVTHKK
jgi:hypothetical protein